MQTLIDYFSFKSFISLDVMRVGYALGAVILPVAGGLLWLWIKRRYRLVDVAYGRGKSWLRQLTSPAQRLGLYGLFILMFVCAEILWRMMFEYLIAYLQIRDVLLQMQMSTHPLNLGVAAATDAMRGAWPMAGVAGRAGGAMPSSAFPGW